ncbi:uncharacterized protein [Aquarana catesbeiana]|uniref:uncharacterized protein n=1 Tax=Aquarana catesbeiana TaxID=8400 RepID=UPI003CCA50AD
MDSVGALWAVALVLPVIFITALCIGCRRRIPVHITETGYYDDKVQYHPPSSSFIVMKGPSGNIILPRTSTSHTVMSTQEMSLIVPRSPIPPDSRRSSVGRDIKEFPPLFDTAPISPGLSPPKNQEVDDEDHEYDDDYPNYANDYKDTPPYIDVLPDISSAKPVEVESPSTLVNRESLSSVIYMNVEVPPQSNEATDDNNYVNVRDSKESLEYVNVEEAVKPPSSTHHYSDDDNIPDYENLENDHIG